MHQCYQTLWRNAAWAMDRMTSTQWFVALIAVGIVGLVCMRGFGSRTNY